MCTHPSLTQFTTKGFGFSLLYFMHSFILPKDVLWVGCWGTVVMPCVGEVS